MKIVGIDASLTGTGVAMVDGSLRTEIIQSKKAGPERLIELRERIKQIVAGANLVVIEGYAYAKGNSAHQIGELGGVLRVMFHEMKLTVLEVAPGQVKKFATGKGNADKRDIAIAVIKRWGIDFKSDDETDAFVLAMIGRAYINGSEGLTVFQAKIIHDLVNRKKTKRRSAKKAG